MKTKDVTKLLKSLGWNVFSEEGERIAILDVGDREVYINYSITIRSGFERMIGTCSVSTNAFSAACATIEPRFGKFSHLITTHVFRIDAPEIFESHVFESVEATIHWAMEQDIDKALSEFASLRTSAPGTGPIHHLAALVLTGKLETLNYYLNSFENGDRLGFVPYITKEHIERAVALAEDKANKSER